MKEWQSHVQFTWFGTNQKRCGHQAQSDGPLFGGEEITKLTFRALALRYLVSVEGLTFETSASLSPHGGNLTLSNYKKYSKNNAYMVRLVLILLRIGEESLKPITKRSNRNHVITFDSHLKTALIP